MEINLGLIGLGYVGKVHLLNGLKLKNAKLLAVSDISKKALNFAEQSGIKKTYNDYKQLLHDKEIDAVIIALPNHLHASCVKEAAENGKHILLEKPLARNIVEGNEIISVARKNSVKLMIGYPSRFSETFQSLKEKIASGMLGDIQLANAIHVGPGPFIHRAEEGIPGPLPEWWLNKDLTGGGALIDLGCHVINLLHWYFGEVSHVDSFLGYRFNLNVEDHAICVLEFKTGQIATVNVGWFAQKSQVKIDLQGTVGNATSAVKNPNRIITAIQLILRQTPSFYQSHLKELQFFINCIRNDSLTTLTGEEALRDLETISIAYENSQSREI